MLFFNSNVKETAPLLKAMYEELYPATCSQNLRDYEEYLKQFTYVFTDNKRDMLLVVKEVTPELLNGPKMYDGVAVYIKPELRKSRVLYNMYKFLFDNFDGQIVGMVHPNSDHNAVVSKRGTLIGTVYALDKAQFVKDK